jgi:hypothetical protein
VRAAAVVFRGICSVALPNPMTVTGGGGSSATFIPMVIEPAHGLTGGVIEASDDVEYHLHMADLGIGILLRYEGGNDQTFRNLKLYIDGTSYAYCLRDQLQSEFPTEAQPQPGVLGGTQNGYNYGMRAYINCINYGGNSGEGAVDLNFEYPIQAWRASTAYYQNNLVTNDSGKTYMAQCDPLAHAAGCTSAGSGGPTGTGQAITDGSNGLTWNYSTQGSQAFTTYDDAQFLGGSVVNQGNGYAFETRGYGTFNGVFNGTYWSGGQGGWLLQNTANIQAVGGSINVYNLAANIGARPITLNGANSAGTVTLSGDVQATTVIGITNQLYQGVGILSGAGGAVVGQLDRGVLSSDPSGLRTCSPQDIYEIITPTAGVPDGWACTTASTTAGSTVFTAR